MKESGIEIELYRQSGNYDLIIVAIKTVSYFGSEFNGKLSLGKINFSFKMANVMDMNDRKCMWLLKCLHVITLNQINARFDRWMTKLTSPNISSK